MDTNYIIETKNLTKQYGSQKSVADLNIHVKRGRIYGLLGRNGAGKTTTMKIFMKLGLVEPLDNGALYMSNIELFIGQSSTEGERKRRARMKISEQKRLSGQVSEAKTDICPPEIEIKKEIDIEIEKERELKPGRAAPAAYGRYKNVILTDTELSELKAELPDKWEYYIDRLSGYIASTGRKYKNHAATIRRWAADDTAKAAPKKGIPDYSYKEGESL